MNKVFIVAEIGNNHEGNYAVAKKLIHNAKLAGADAVKFQAYNVNKYVSGQNKERFNRLKKFQLTFKEFLKLKQYAKKLHIKFFATPLDIDSLKFLLKNTSILKISSGDNNNFYYINKILEKNKTCIISTGFLSKKEIDILIKKIIRKFGKKKVSKKVKILHCISSYPAKKEILNISVVKYLHEKYDLEVGYSDHSIGIQACCLAVAYGASIIEKHFTLDKNYSSFHDHLISSDLDEMRDLVKSVRDIEKMIGNKNKKIQRDEKKIINLARRSFYALKNIKLGEKITFDKISPMRPFLKNSYDFDNIKKIIDKKSKRNFKKGDVIK